MCGGGGTEDLIVLTPRRKAEEEEDMALGDVYVINGFRIYDCASVKHSAIAYEREIYATPCCGIYYAAAAAERQQKTS